MKCYDLPQFEDSPSSSVQGEAILESSRIWRFATGADECESLSPRYTLCTEGFQEKHALPLKKCSTLVMFRAMFSFSGESPGKGGYVNEPEPPLTLNRLFSYDGIPGNHH